MIVTAHQPNYLPGESVLAKVAAADAIIWLDEVQLSRGGWTNRNRMPDGSWLTVPLEHGDQPQPVNRARIAEHDNWRLRHCRTLAQHYGEEATEELRAEIERPYRLLVGLNLALLEHLVGHRAGWRFQSHLDGGRAAIAVSDDRAELAPISQRLAMMVQEIGGTSYLSGPSGRNYLDETPFYVLGIAVDYFEWAGQNPCSAGTYARA